jgi:DNA polymerase I-like protein with 3'-5' exonuclease and polymerase domains
MGVKKLAKALGLDDWQTKALLEKYHQKVPFMKALLQRCAQVAAERGYVKTILGRRRRYEEWENAEFGATWERPVSKEAAEIRFARIRRAGTYKAINSIVQGSAAEQTKSAIVRSVKEYGLYPLMQVYDELSYSLSDPMDALKVKDCMENAIKFEVPHLVDSSLGTSWAAVKKENYEKMIVRTI